MSVIERKLADKCDSYGLPHDFDTLMRHMENNHAATVGAQKDHIESLRRQLEGAVAESERLRAWLAIVANTTHDVTAAMDARRALDGAPPITDAYGGAVGMRVAACIIEHLAKEFHDTYERLAPEYGYETREASAVPWADVPEQNKALMMATVEHVMAGAVARVEALEQGIRVFLAAEHDTLESTPAYLALVLRRGQ